MKSTERLIFHIDVNSAFLSWESARRVSQGIPEKMWPLPVRNLLFLGKASEQKLLNQGIRTALAWRKTRAQMKNEDRQEE